MRDLPKMLPIEALQRLSDFQGNPKGNTRIITIITMAIIYDYYDILPVCLVIITIVSSKAEFCTTSLTRGPPFGDNHKPVNP